MDYWIFGTLFSNIWKNEALCFQCLELLRVLRLFAPAIFPRFGKRRSFLELRRGWVYEEAVKHKE